MSELDSRLNHAGMTFMVSSPNLNLDPDLNLNKDVFEYKLILQNADQRSGIRIRGLLQLV